MLAACCASVADPKLLVCCLDFRNSPKQLRNTSNASESNKSNCIIDGSNLLKIPRRGGLCDKLAMVDQELQPPPKPTAQLLSLRELCLRTLKRWMSRVDSVLPVLQFAQEVRVRYACRLPAVTASVSFRCYSSKLIIFLLSFFLLHNPTRSNFQTAPLSLSSAQNSLLYVWFDFQSSPFPSACLTHQFDIRAVQCTKSPARTNTQ